ncbi:hypothetical protein Droror1_Dr00026482 [Drosera rotundifolia]
MGVAHEAFSWELFDIALAITRSTPYALVFVRIEALGLGEDLSMGVLNLSWRWCYSGHICGIRCSLIVRVTWIMGVAHEAFSWELFDIALAITRSTPYALVFVRIEALGLGEDLSMGVLNRTPYALVFVRIEALGLGENLSMGVLNLSWRWCYSGHICGIRCSLIVRVTWIMGVAHEAFSWELFDIPLAITRSTPYALVFVRIEALGLGEDLSMGVLNLVNFIPQAEEIHRRWL